MPKVRKDTSILEQYREQYEAGLITQIEIQKKTGISQTIFRKYIFANNWNIELAKRNKYNILYKKIIQYKDDYEQGKISIFQISKKLKTRSTFVSEVAKKDFWNATANEEKRINIATKNLKPISGKNRIWEKAMEATKKRWEKLHQFSNLAKGSTIYVSGVAYIWNGFKHNKARLKTLLYSKHTYTETQIKKYESNKR